MRTHADDAETRNTIRHVRNPPRPAHIQSTLDAAGAQTIYVPRARIRRLFYLGPAKCVGAAALAVDALRVGDVAAQPGMFGLRAAGVVLAILRYAFGLPRPL